MNIKCTDADLLLKTLPVITALISCVCQALVQMLHKYLFFERTWEPRSSLFSMFSLKRQQTKSLSRAGRERRCPTRAEGQMSHISKLASATGERVRKTIFFSCCTVKGSPFLVRFWHGSENRCWGNNEKRLRYQSLLWVWWATVAWFLRILCLLLISNRFSSVEPHWKVFLSRFVITQ